ncbi:MAG: c-type cytochrome [Betaproteobacteria bacterium]|nr:c-type cytochrome [Betaproteobacteria bacterium]
MKATFFKIFAFLLVTVSTYSYVGQLVPQFEEYPPAKKVIAVSTPPAELAAIGEELVRVKGGCLICHKVTETGNERGPDLRKAAGQAATRKPGMDAGAYLLEALTQPEVFLVPGYPKMMPSALKPPANMNLAEVKAIIAYLQTLGGAEVTVKIVADDIKAAKAAGPVHKGKEAMGAYGWPGRRRTIRPASCRPISASRFPRASVTKSSPTSWACRASPIRRPAPNRRGRTRGYVSGW